VATEQRCRDCGAPSTGALCAPCEQDRLLEQTQLKTPEAEAIRGEIEQQSDSRV
jgi:hypothetical protein